LSQTFDFKAFLEGYGIVLTDAQEEQFEQYYAQLVEWNEKMNLTAITEKNEVYLKHFADSIFPILQGLLKNEPIQVVDVGAGAGFPSIPMKILYPKLKLTIVDSLNKRIQFLNHLAEELGLQDVAFVHSRAEDFGKDSENRERYDVAFARAVARMSVLSELCLPLVKKGGQFIALKSQKTSEELEDAEMAIKVLGGKVEKEFQYELPISSDQRTIVVVNKIRKTPSKYPRKAGMPGKQPIGEQTRKRESRG
jgi:16S rRNA (guanine527-N7)-methyltransferase